MSDQDPFKSDINYHTGQFHTSAEKLAAGVNYGDSSWSAADKLRRYNENNGNTYGGSGGGGLAALAVVAILAFYYAVKNTVGPFKRATGINAFLYVGIAVILYGLAFYSQGFPKKYIKATSDTENLDLYRYDGHLSIMTPDMDFFGRPKRYVDDRSPNYSVYDLAEVYSGILTKNELMVMNSDSIYHDPSISAMRTLAVKKGLADQFDQRTIDYLTETYRKDPKYKDAKFVITKGTDDGYKYNVIKRDYTKYKAETVTYTLEEK